MRSSRVVARFDLCGWVRFPGSSKVQAAEAARQDWQGWPSSHLILLRRQRSHARDSLNRRSLGGGAGLCSMVSSVVVVEFGGDASAMGSSG